MISVQLTFLLILLKVSGLCKYKDPIAVMSLKVCFRAADSLQQRVEESEFQSFELLQ